jgi:very-short-patch-repair endonuclease
MTENLPNREAGERARSLRTTHTVSEGLLWSVQRARQLCGLKFRREHPIEPWIVDFACPQQMLVVEIDGGYHDNVVANDVKRPQHLESLGWKVIRFSDKDVEDGRLRDAQIHRARPADSVDRTPGILARECNSRCVL